jgi:hypothetical protein
MSTKTKWFGAEVAIGLALVLAVTGALVAVLWMDHHGSQSSGLGPQFNYDLTEMRKVDPALIQFVEKDAIPTGFQNVHALAVGPADTIFVAGDNGIRSFDSKGSKLKDVDAGAPVNCLGIDETGAIYAGLRDHVEVFDAAGVRRARWASPGPASQLTSIAVSKNDVFAADWSARVVYRYDTNGTVLSEIGRKDAAKKAAGFVVPSPYFDIALSRGGMLLVANTGRHQVEAYSRTGEFQSGWGRYAAQVDGFCGCCNPAHFALLPDGRIVTTEKGLLRVKTYSDQGVFESVVAPPSAFPEQPMACQNDCRTGLTLPVAADSRGRVLVLDPAARTVRVFVAK